MKINCSSDGRTRVISDIEAIEAVEDAFREAGLDPRKLDLGFLPYWIAAGKTINEMLAIAGLQPRKDVAA